MLPKAHLTLHSRMSVSRWVITPSWLSGPWTSFLYSSSVCSCHLFLMSSASVRSLPFLSFIVPVFAWNVPLVSLHFWKRSLVFPILLFFSISLHWLLRKAYLSLLAILWNSAFKCVYLSFSPLPFVSLLFSANYYRKHFVLSRNVNILSRNVTLLPQIMREWKDFLKVDQRQPRLVWRIGLLSTHQQYQYHSNMELLSL